MRKEACGNDEPKDVVTRLPRLGQFNLDPSNLKPDGKTMKSTLELNETNFDREVLEASTPVIVDFWAEWCGPCKMLAPVLEEIAREQQGQAAVMKVNIDENPGLAARFNIQSIPTLLYFKEGAVRDQTIGVVSKKLVNAKLAALRSVPSVPAS